jgi:hypothetical protein
MGEYMERKLGGKCLGRTGFQFLEASAPVA